MPIGMYARAVDLKPGVDEFIHITKDGVRHYIPNAIEYGHDSAAPIPYLRRAFESTKTQAGLTLQEQLRKGIIKEIK